MNVASNDDDDVNEQPQQSPSLGKADDKDATPEGMGQVVTANNQFAISLYQQLNSQADAGNKNIFFSPYSLSTAMAMLYVAAAGETKQQIQHTFYYPILDILNPNSAALYNRFNQPSVNYQLTTTNDLWLQQGLTPNPKYVDMVQRYYGSGVSNLDFATSPEPSRQTINQHIAEQTHGMIAELLPSGSINSDTASVLTNSIYFKGDWQMPFVVESTTDKPFYLFDGAVTQVKMMQQTDDFAYTEDKRTQVIQLPYQGDELSMLVVLPKSKNKAGMQSVIQKLTPSQISKWIDTLNKQQVVLALPKFKLSQNYKMKPLLADMPIVFSDNDDFCLFNQQFPLKISDVYHQAVVEIDETGTKAAAATAIVMDWMSATISQSIEFIANHPFLFIIRDNKTNTILFLGQVNKP